MAERVAGHASAVQDGPDQVTARPRVSLLASRALTTGLGLFVVALADFAARRGLAVGDVLFWLGLVVLVAPIALPLWSPRPSRNERLGLALLVGVGLWFVRLLYSPGAFVFYDEFSHWRTAIDIVNSGRLLTPNLLQPISALYPGLEAVTAMLSSLSGLPLELSGLLMVFVGRVILVLGLFIFLERVSRSARVAGLAVLVYVANPSFVFFDAQFSYESFAIGLAALSLAILTLREEPRQGRTAYTWLAAAAVVATVVTHHVTSYELIAFVAVWAIAGRLVRAPDGDAPPLRLVLFAAAAALAWLLLVASTTVGYLLPHIIGGAQQLLLLIQNESLSRQFFVDNAGTTAPLAERVVAYLGVLLILAALPLGLRVIYRFERDRAVAIALALVAIVYPISLVGRLTSEGVEAASRLSAFVFVGVAFVIAMWGSRATRLAASMAARGLAATGTAIVFASGVILGTPGWARLTYAYRPAADPRSVDNEGIAAASWTKSALGPDHQFAADRTNRRLLGTYGLQQATNNFDSANLLLSSNLAAAQRAIVEQHVDYVLVDRRLSDDVPLVTGYVVLGELGGYRFTTPVPLEYLTKLDGMASVSRIYDSGDIQIYDVRRIR